MKPNRVPDDLIQASSDAIRAWCTANPDKYLDDRTQMRIAVAAALTLHNEQVEQPLRERAETAERELAEMRERVGDLGKEWGCRYKDGDMLRGFESEADVRSGSAPGATIYHRVVGEWQAAEQQTEE